jgi:hypothetical protein
VREKGDFYMKTNLIPAGSVPINNLKVGDCFISIATSDLHKGERAIYLKLNMYDYVRPTNNKPWLDLYAYAVNLSTGHIRKFDKGILVEPCPDACVNV